MAASVFNLAVVDPNQTITKSEVPSFRATSDLLPAVLSVGSESSDHRHWLFNWLDSVVFSIFWNLTDQSQVTLPAVRKLIPHIGFPTRLACALQYYHTARNATHLITDSTFTVCLDHSLLALLEGTVHSAADHLLQDDCVNGVRLCEWFKQLLIPNTDINTQHSRLLDYFTQTDLTTPISTEKQLNLLTDFYQWICPNPSSKCALVSLQTIPFTDPGATHVACTGRRSSTGSSVLQKLVKTSAVIVRPTRPAHPNNRPLALLNALAVEQLVSSTTSSATVAATTTTTIHSMNSTDANCPATVNGSNESAMNVVSGINAGCTDNALLTDLAQTAATRADSCFSTVEMEGQASGGYYVARHVPESTTSMECSPASPSEVTRIGRSKLYATFRKNPSPIVSDKLPVIGSPRQSASPTPKGSRQPPSTTGAVLCKSPAMPSLRSEFEQRKMGRPAPTGGAQQPTCAPAKLAKNELPSGTTTWAKTPSINRQSLQANDIPDSSVTGEGSISSSTTSSVDKVFSRSTAVSLRWSLDQRRRAIEVGRRKALAANEKAVAQRHHAAFQKLLQSEQHRRSDKVSQDNSPNPSIAQRASNAEMEATSCSPDVSLLEPTESFDDTPQKDAASLVGQTTDIDEDFSNRSTECQLSSTALPATPSFGLVEECSTHPDNGQPVADSSDYPDFSAHSPNDPSMCDVCVVEECDTRTSNEPLSGGTDCVVAQGTEEPIVSTCTQCPLSPSECTHSDRYPTSDVPTPPDRLYESQPHISRASRSSEARKIPRVRQSTPQPFTEELVRYHPISCCYCNETHRSRDACTASTFDDCIYDVHRSTCCPMVMESAVYPVISRSPTRVRRHVPTSHRCHHHGLTSRSLNSEAFKEQRIPHSTFATTHHHALLRNHPSATHNHHCQEEEWDDQQTGLFCSYEEDDGEYDEDKDEESPGSGSEVYARSSCSHRQLELDRCSDMSYAHSQMGGSLRPRRRFTPIDHLRSSHRRKRLTPVSCAHLIDASDEPEECPDNFNHSLVDLQSGFERLAMLNSCDPMGVNAGQRLRSSNTSLASSTRATWSERLKVGDLHVGTVRKHSPDLRPSADTTLQITRTPNARRRVSELQLLPSHPDSVPQRNRERSSFVESHADILSSAVLDAERMSVSAPIVPKTSSQSPVAHNGTESQQFFIAFEEEPDPQRMQRKYDQLEARRAREKAAVAQQLQAHRDREREEKQSHDLTQHERRANELNRREALLQAHRNRKEAEGHVSRPSDPYPVRSGSVALSRSETSLSLSGRNRRATSQTTGGKRTTRQPVSDVRASIQRLRPKSTNKPITSPIQSAVGMRGIGDGKAVETSEGDEDDHSSYTTMTTTPKNKEKRESPKLTNGKSTPHLPSGLSLSSLHRLGAAESSSSGPGIPVLNSTQPKLFVKPKAKSNRMVIVNAIGHACLAGTVNEPMKQATLKELAATEGTHFMILFRDSRCQYRAVYYFDLELEELRLICGTGPRKITHDMANRFYKYNSGGKHFTEITSTNHLSPVVDAITIHDNLWNKSSGPSAALNLVSGRH